jgi:hypothetical protein
VVDKKQLRKAAWLSAAGSLAATGVVGVAQGTASAAVSYYCEGWNPNSTTASSRVNLETVAKSSHSGMNYPKLSLRMGIANGDEVIWTRQSIAMQGLLALDWGPAANNTTHWKCSVQTDYNTANYTTGVSYGFYSSAYYFRPCELRSSPNGSSTNVGPWECGGWWH